jgi:hypothetical protein
MKGHKINTRVVIPAITFCLGILWVVYGLTKYRWWDSNGPASGFFPSIVGVLLACVSIIAILDGRKLKPPTYLKASYHPLAAAIATVVSTLLIGFFPALFVYLLGWLKLYEKYGWKLSLSVSVITTLCCYGIFVLWLKVPFPMGFIVNTIRG